MGERVAVAENNEAVISKTLPLPLELMRICPQKLKHLQLGSVSILARRMAVFGIGAQTYVSYLQARGRTNLVPFLG